MTDVFTKEFRSDLMRRIPSKNTNPELLVRRYLHKLGYRFTLNSKKLPGKPDISLPKYKTVILINGCFWHRHQNCKEFRMPRSNIEYWERKFEKNVERDKVIRKQLRKLGWKVVTVWECELKSNKIDRTIMKIIEAINS